MPESKTLKELFNILESLHKEGHESVLVTNLIKYLADKNAGHELAQKDFENTCRSNEIRTPINVELLKAEIEAGGSALKTAILINGGATIALLAFIGNLITRTNTESHTSLFSAFITPLILFVAGVGFASAAMAIRYITQFFYTSCDVRGAKTERHAKKAHIITIILGVLSLIAFIAGGTSSYQNLNLYVKEKKPNQSKECTIITLPQS
ncbi:MAG: hypothetical protein AB7S81_07675 [Bdellovibrionales bacterium]